MGDGHDHQDRAAGPAPEEFRLDRRAFSVSSLHEQDDDGVYWRSRQPAERVAALAYLRWMAYGPAAVAPLQRVLTIVDLGSD